MKIVQITPLYEAVPPKLYGGTERVGAHLTDALGHFRDALGKYRAREFESARVLFEKVLTLNPADKTAKLYVERCDHLIASPPPPSSPRRTISR